jgi:hypothetical protein
MNNDVAFDNIALLCIKTKVQLIIIDEAQQFLPDNQSAMDRVITLADALKNLVDKCGCAILLTGLPNLKRLLTLPGRAEWIAKQLQRRSYAMHPFAKLEPQEVHKVLLSIDAKFIEYEVNYKLSSEENFKRFFICSNGTISTIFDTIIESLYQTGSVSADSLAIAYEDITTTNKFNPFKMNKTQLEKPYGEATKNFEEDANDVRADNAE